MKFLKALFAIALCQLIGNIGTLFTISAIPNWYSKLNKPLFAPPNTVFGPVWIILYTLMGISLFIIWEKRKKNWDALKLFGIQLFLNAIWSPIFFGLKNLGAALVVILLMWYLIYRTIKAFEKIDMTAAILLYPYLLWVSVATILNLSILLLN